MLEEMMPRWVPTENVNGFEICPGLYRDEGATAFQSAVNFIVHWEVLLILQLVLLEQWQAIIQKQVSHFCVQQI